MKFFGIPYKRRQLHFLVGDSIAALLAVHLGHAFRFGFGDPRVWRVLVDNSGGSLFFLCSSLLVLYVADAYNSSLDFRRPRELARVWTAVFVALLLQILVYAMFPHGWWGRGVAALTSLSFAVLVSTWRFGLGWVGPAPVVQLRTLVVGAGHAARVLVDVIHGHHEYDRLYDVVGLLDHPRGGRRRRDDYAEDELSDGDTPGPILGDVSKLSELVGKNRVDLVVVAVRGSMNAELTRQLLECKKRGVRIEDMPTVYKRLTGKLPILHLSDAWIIFGPGFSGTRPFAAAVQRILDVVLALFGLTVSAPVVAVAAVAVKLESPGPAFFVQERLGRNEVPFPIYKLRTMRQDAEAKTGAVWSQGAGDPRVTRVGRFLRRSRIDELPQFYNVLTGDMSLVGPRPEREPFVTRLKEKIPFYALRFSVKPGLTGWAQVKYRYGATEEDAAEKLCYELYAVQEMSPAVYALTLLKTMQTVLLRPGS